MQILTPLLFLVTLVFTMVILSADHKQEELHPSLNRVSQITGFNTSQMTRQKFYFFCNKL